MATALLSSELRELYNSESARIQQEFAAAGDGRQAVLRRAGLLDRVITRLYEKLLSPEAGAPGNFVLAAIGGYGRSWLFPYSDVDLLFLHADRESEAQLKDRIRSFSQELWDLGIKLSPASRTMAECDRFDPNNV